MSREAKIVLAALLIIMVALGCGMFFCRRNDSVVLVLMFIATVGVALATPVAQAWEQYNDQFRNTKGETDEQH